MASKEKGESFALFFKRLNAVIYLRCEILHGIGSKQDGIHPSQQAVASPQVVNFLVIIPG